MIVYHYSDTKFEAFDDAIASDGFWFTDIKPEDKEMLNEIGASGLKYVAVCSIDFDDSLVNGDNHDVAEQLEASGCDAIENLYDGFTDYALIDDSKVSIIEWMEL